MPIHFRLSGARASLRFPKLNAPTTGTPQTAPFIVEKT